MTTQAPVRRDGADLAAGDVIMFLGRPHLVTHFDKASDKTCALVGDPAARVACAADGWRMTVHRFQPLDVVVAPVAVPA